MWRRVDKKKLCNLRQAWSLVLLAFLVFAVGVAIVLIQLRQVAAAEPDPSRRVREIGFIILTAEVDPLAFETAHLIVKNWRTLGFDVKLIPVDASRMADAVWTRRDYDIALSRFSGRRARLDPDYWIYGAFSTKGHANETLYSNPEYDRLASEQRTVLDLNKRRQIVFKAQEIVASDQPFTPIVHPFEFHGYNQDRFTDVEPMLVEGLNGSLTFFDMKPKGTEKILKWGFPQAVSTLNPAGAGVALSHDLNIMSLIYESLVRLDREGYPQNWAATEIKEISPTVLEIKIRQGMKFHDGKPVTVEDVRFTYELFRKEKASWLYEFTSMISEIRPIDERTLRFVLDKPFAPFRTLSVSMVPILPKHIWDGLPQKAGLSNLGDWPNIPPIGSGPFKYAYWRRAEELKLVRNGAHFKPPQIEGIIDIPYADGQGTVLGLEKGENDLVSWNLGPINAKGLAKFKNIKVVSVRTNAVFGVDYNNTREPFTNIKVRQALAYAIPKSQIIREIYDGQAEIGQAVIAPVNKFWHNPNIMKFDLDMARARRLLQEAGYEWDSQGKIYGPAK